MYICMYVSMYVCRVCIYVCMYVCMYVGYGIVALREWRDGMYAMLVSHPFLGEFKMPPPFTDVQANIRCPCVCVCVCVWTNSELEYARMSVATKWNTAFPRSYVQVLLVVVCRRRF